MPPADPYAVLGVQRDADAATVKAAYRRAALERHPDRGGDPARFREVAEAYAILSDPGRRAAWDRGERAPQGFVGVPPPWSGIDAAIAEIIDMAGGGRASRARRNVKGADLAATITVTDDEARRGGEREITGTWRYPCPACGGTGAIGDSLFGIVVVATACAACGGGGKLPITRTVAVKIPRGVKAGTRLRLRGMGAPGTGDGRAGDMYVTVAVKVN